VKWEQVLQDHQGVRTNEGIESDPFDIVSGVRVTRGTPGIMTSIDSVEVPHTRAKVSYTIGRSLSYGEFKASVTVTLECPQTEAFINLAGELAYEKAKELVDDGFCSIVPDALPLPKRI